MWKEKAGFLLEVLSNFYAAKFVCPSYFLFTIIMYIHQAHL